MQLGILHRRTTVWMAALPILTATLFASAVGGCRADGQPFALVDPLIAQSALSPTSWLGNTFSASDDKQAVQRRISDIFVLPDGTVYTYSDYNGGAYRAVAYQNGRRVGRLASATGGNTVTVADGVVYLDDYSVAQTPRILRLTPDGLDAAPGIPLPPTAKVHGLVVHDSELFVSENTTGTIFVYDLHSEPPTIARSLSLDRAGELAADVRDTLWVVQEATSAKPGAVLGVDRTTGNALPGKTITAVEDPRDVTVDPNDRLWIADAGPSEQLRVFDHLDGVPRLATPFGTAGGVFSSVAGQVVPGKLDQPNAVGLDAAGVVYVNNALHGHGAHVEAYRSDGTRLWDILCLGAIYDVVVMDPASDRDAYGKAAHFVFDWSLPLGREVQWVGITEDPRRYDQLAETTQALGDSTLAFPIGLRTLGSKPFLAMSDQLAPSSMWMVGLGHDGEIGIPVLAFGHPQRQPSWPGEPADMAVRWQDANGDGRMSANEYLPLGVQDIQDDTWSIDDAGDLWAVVKNALGQPAIARWAFGGLDAAGIPRYLDIQQGGGFAIPPMFSSAEISKFLFHSEDGAALLTGYTLAHPAPTPATSSIGAIVARYDQFASGAPALRWQTTVESAMDPTGPPNALAMAGRYVFVGHRLGGVVQVLSWDDGHVVDVLTPQAPVFADRETGALSAHLRTAGEYAVFVDEGYYQKVIVHRWNPRAPRGLVATKVNASTNGFALTWAPPLEGIPSVYRVLRANAQFGTYDVVPGVVTGTQFLDTTQPAPSDPWYRVAAFYANGPAAYSVSVQPSGP